MTTYAEHPAAGSPDGLLVRAYLAGDSAAFDTLYRLYHPLVLRLLKCKVHDHEVAEDLAQETMTRALDRLDGFDQSRPFLPYVYKIANNLLPAYWRRTSTEVSVEEIRENALSMPDDAERIVTIRAVTEALAKIEKRHRDVLYLRYAEDCDGNELADLYGLKRNALEQLLSRARNAMRKQYREPAVVVPGFAGLAARLRRFLTDAGTRLQVASGAGASVAGELAIGAAITVGGIGLVIHGARADATDGRVVRATAVTGDRGVIAYERIARDLYSGLPHGADDAERPVAAGTLPGQALRTGAEGADDATAGSPAADAPVAEDETGGAYPDPAADPGGGVLPGAPPAPEWGHGGDTPDPPKTRGYVAPPSVASPDAEVWVDDDSAGAEAGVDEAGTSNNLAVNRKISEEGEVASTTVETNLTGEGDTAVIKVENSGDGSVLCDYAGVCVPI